ncbi:apoptosis regulator BAX-like [Tubulanus polymorphus]|uniref:apoptosis regulator BAX-like n=1 Tax=Tubulanus polymorphus TaxID=672921 RepID=UPI003DA3DCAE
MATAAQACQCCATTGTNNCGLRQRRLSAHSLPLLEMPGSVNAPATHVVYQGGDMNNVEVEGRELFGNFLREEINRERLPGDVDVEQCIMDTPICSTPNFQRANPMWASTGRELREMADAFAKTKERQRIRNEANAVGSNISFKQFQDMLTELFFNGGVTKERIMVLFFFCSDLAIRMLREKAIDYFKKFIDWSLRYITECVCQWVREHGGWGAVLSSGMQVATKIGIMVVLGVCSIAMFQWMSRRIS